MGENPEEALIRYRTRALMHADESPWLDDTLPNDRFGRQYITYRYRLPADFDDPLEELAATLELGDWDRTALGDSTSLEKRDFMPALGLLADPRHFDVVDSRPRLTQRFRPGTYVIVVAMIVTTALVGFVLEPLLLNVLALALCVGFLFAILIAIVYLRIFAGTRPGFGLTARPVETTIRLYKDDGYVVDVLLAATTYEHDPEIEELFRAELGQFLERDTNLLG